MRSDDVKRGVEKAPSRSLLRASGLTDADMEKPFIGVADSWNTVVPGHIHLDRITEAVVQGIEEAGGKAFVFGVPAVCDGMAMGHEGMRYSLVSRETIADSCEIMCQAHRFDGWVGVTNCDKVTPGMLMAAARLDLPSIFVSGGPMLAGHIKGGDKRGMSLSSMFEAVGRYADGKMSDEEFLDWENSACPSCGSCSGMYTANSMNCLCEAIGMALPGNGTIPAVYSERLRLAKDAGYQIMELLRKGITARSIMTEKAFMNALSVDMALGCSTNTMLHLPAIAHEAGIEIDIFKANDISRRVPNLCHLAPAGRHHMQDLMRAGGISAVMKELLDGGMLHGDCLSVTGKTLAENVKKAKNMDETVIRPLSDPYSKTGGLAVLFGNLAPNGAIVKRSAVKPEMLVNTGTARCFDSEEEAIAAIYAGKIVPGDIVVIRYEGPSGGPGMREMLSPTSAIVGMKLDTTVALLTDGRFSGASCGAAIGHISPEAAAGGPIAYVKDGDPIAIDIPNYSLKLLVSDEELAKRKETMKLKEPKELTGYLKRYAKSVSSADKGAIVE